MNNKEKLMFERALQKARKKQIQKEKEWKQSYRVKYKGKKMTMREFKNIQQEIPFINS